MARGRGPVLILSSLLLAGGAAWMANKWIRSRAASPAAVASVHVLTAAMNLPLGTKIETRHVASMEVIPGQEPPGSFHDFKEVEGKEVEGMKVHKGKEVEGMKVQPKDGDKGK